MKMRCALALGFLLLASCTPVLLSPHDARFTSRAPDTFRVRFATSAGEFVVDVHREWAPIGADRFYNLVRQRFFDGQRFFRVRAGFIAQFGIHGDPRVAQAWRNATMADDPPRQSNVRGTLAYAFTTANTRATQIYVNLADNTQLDGQGFAPFGIIVSGTDVIDRIYSGYGENAGGGMRAGHQDALFVGGNAYMTREYPRLDFIQWARVE